jgi:hypothetical protein
MVNCNGKLLYCEQPRRNMFLKSTTTLAFRALNLQPGQREQHNKVLIFNLNEVQINVVPEKYLHKFSELNL